MWLLILVSRPPPRRNLHRSGLRLHHWRRHAALLRRLWQVIQRWQETAVLLTKRMDAKYEMPPLRSSSFLRVYSGRREDQLFPAVSPQTLIHKDKWPKNLRLQMRSWTQQKDQIHLKDSSKLQNPDEFRVSDVSVRRWVAPQRCVRLLNSFSVAFLCCCESFHQQQQKSRTRTRR